MRPYDERHPDWIPPPRDPILRVRHERCLDRRYPDRFRDASPPRRRYTSPPRVPIHGSSSSRCFYEAVPQRLLQRRKDKDVAFRLLSPPPTPVWSPEAIEELRETMWAEFLQRAQSLINKETPARPTTPPTSSASPTKLIEDIMQEADAQKTKSPQQVVTIDEQETEHPDGDRREIHGARHPEGVSPSSLIPHVHHQAVSHTSSTKVIEDLRREEVVPIDAPIPAESKELTVKLNNMDNFSKPTAPFMLAPAVFMLDEDRILPPPNTGSKRGRFDFKGRRMMRSYLDWCPVAAVPRAPRPWRPPLTKQPQKSHLSPNSNPAHICDLSGESSYLPSLSTFRSEILRKQTRLVYMISRIGIIAFGVLIRENGVLQDEPSFINSWCCLWMRPFKRIAITP